MPTLETRGYCSLLIAQGALRVSVPKRNKSDLAGECPGGERHMISCLMLNFYFACSVAMNESTVFRNATPSGPEKS